MRMRSAHWECEKVGQPHQCERKHLVSWSTKIKTFENEREHSLAIIVRTLLPGTPIKRGHEPLLSPLGLSAMTFEIMSKVTIQQTSPSRPPSEDCIAKRGDIFVPQPVSL
ncbi:hypothetical protein AVEN_210686-1 [Araneus ventricosus]|uniref:Uncharacterized protein n=1 Tax=Araneus ventricosus TaxID=182803 RepID=A0A4Y2VBN4_ARAVE|nr:hypothetical protein AVEN_210686-1 [Araneus ventricosus]